MFAPGAVRWIGPVAAAAVVLGGLLGVGVVPLSPASGAGLVALAAVSIFFAVFFRDPDRPPGAGIVSPADGRVRAVDRIGERLLISVFMHVRDVHVNRAPLDATVESIEGAGAGFRAAFRPDADRNVRRHYRLATAIGPAEVVQISGVVARRIVPWVRAGASLRKGERFGMIVLGSRVDLYLPAGRVRATVRVGDRVRAGVSTVAEVEP